MEISSKTYDFLAKSLDLNHDGISSKELAQLDTDHDGKVDAKYRDKIVGEDLRQVEDLLEGIRTGRLSSSDAIVIAPRPQPTGTSGALQKPTVVVGPSADTSASTTATDTDREARRQVGAKLAGTIDIGTSMTVAQYDKSVTSPTGTRQKLGYFAKAQAQLAEQARQVDMLLTQAKAKRPPDAAEIERLTHTKDLVFSLQNLYAQLKVSVATDAYTDAAATISRIAEAREMLAWVSPEDIGPENRSRIERTLDDLTSIALAYPSLKGTAGFFDVFILKTYRRLQQIGEGNRQRANETHDITGALATYANDAADMMTFVARFRGLDKDLQAGKYKSVEAFEKAMLAAVAKTSPAFQKSVALLARAKWSTYQASLKVSAAATALGQASQNATAALEELKKARGNLEGAAAKAELSQEALQQRDVAGAREAVNTAQTLYDEAGQHLSEYGRYRLMGERFTKQANEQLALARLCLDAAAGCNELVKQGPYAAELSGQTKSIDLGNARLRKAASDIDADLVQITANLREMDKYRTELTKWRVSLGTSIGQLDASVKLVDIEQRAEQMVKGGIDTAHKRYAALLAGYELSDAARKYLADPSNVPEDDRADVREELAELFAKHPLLAQAFAREVTSMRSDFEAVRKDLTAKFGADSPQVKAIDGIEHKLLEAWMQKDGLLMQALANAAFDNPGVRSALAGTVEWMQGSHARYSRLVLMDPARNQQVAAQFHTWMLTQGEMKERFDEVKGDYGAPLSQVPMTLALDKSGQLVTFNAYVFKDGDTYKVLNPLDKRIYSGSSPEAALAALAAEAKLGDGVLTYADATGLKTGRTTAPANSIGWDIGMGVVGVVGGVLLLAPEPTTLTKWGGGAMMAASSAYFVGKGTLKVIDLVQHETLGNNAETWGAALDIASGLLVFTRGGSLLSQAVRSEAQIAKSLVAIGKSTAMTAAEWTAFSGGVALASHQLYEVYNNPNLSDHEKLKAGALIVGSLALPLAFAPAVSLGRRIIAARSPETVPTADVKAAHDAYMTKFGEIDALVAEIAKADSPQARIALRKSLETVLADAKAVYESPVMKQHQEWRAAGLEKIARLEQVLATLPAIPTSRLASADATKIADIRGDLKGEPVAVREVPGKRLIQSEGQLEPGTSKADGQIKARQRFDQLAAELEATTAGTQLRVVKNGNQVTLMDAAGKPVQRITYADRGYGQIKIEDFRAGKSFIETIDFVSMPKQDAPTRTRTLEDATEWRFAENRDAKIPTPKELAAIKGTAGDKVGDFRGIRGASIRDIVSRIPKDAELRELSPDAKGASQGFEYSWTTVNAQGQKTTMRVRIHGPDASRGPNENAGQGWVVVVEKGGLRMDGSGNFHGPSVLKELFEDKSPNPGFDADLANNTHIPIEGNPALSGPTVLPVDPRREPDRETMVPLSAAQ